MHCDPVGIAHPDCHDAETAGIVGIHLKPLRQHENGDAPRRRQIVQHLAVLVAKGVAVLDVEEEPTH